MITQARLKELFIYKNGGLYYRVQPQQSKNTGNGKPIGTVSRGKQNRVVATVEGKRYMVHRLVFLYCKGWLPAQIDHKDGNPMNNKISNLRPASHAEQQWNRTNLRRNKSGFKGVHKHGKNWRVEIMAHGKRVRVSGFKTKEDAARKFNELALKVHGKFARINKL